MSIINNRIILQTLLEQILGSRNVYFQPPENVKMIYPCIVYSRSSGDSQYADDTSYIFKNRYQIMVIDKNPDGPVLDKIRKLPLCSFDRHYVVNNLNHDVYNIYY